MARLFNVEVFNQIIGKAQAYYTGQEFYALLASADRLSVQVIVDSVVETSTAVDVLFQTTNILEEWAWFSAEAETKLTVSVAPLDEAPMVGGGPMPPEEQQMGAYARLKVTTTKTGAAVRIVVCGRSNCPAGGSEARDEVLRDPARAHDRWRDGRWPRREDADAGRDPAGGGHRGAGSRGEEYERVRVRRGLPSRRDWFTSCAALIAQGPERAVCP